MLPIEGVMDQDVDTDEEDVKVSMSTLRLELQAAINTFQTESDAID